MKAFIGRLLCRLGFHDKETVSSITGRTGTVRSLMDGWCCRRCHRSWGPLEWPKPSPKART